MIVISDTTPLITLLKIDRIDLLEIIFKEVIIPKTVYNELISKNYADEAKTINDSKFIKVIEYKDKKKIKDIKDNYSLDLGESESIALALSYKECTLIVDELKARKVALRMGLKITGSIGIILYSYDKGYINKEEVLSYLETFKLTNRYISDNLYEKLRNKINN